MEISNGYHQAMASHHPVLDHEALGCPKASASQHVQQQLQQDQKKPRPQLEHALRCPRCDSTNTKFCYYNNYSLSQPRYFCKGCRRYWTKGGSLRNVPVGGGCRKNKRTSPSTSNSSSSSTKKSSALHQADPNDNFPTNTIATSASFLSPTMPLPTLTYEPNHDLTLAFDPFLLGNHNPNPSPGPVPTSTGPAGFLEMLRSGFVESTPSNEGGGFQSLYYGFGGGSGGGGDHHLRGMLSFDGGVGGNDSTTASASTGVVLLQANAHDAASNGNAGNNSHVSLGMDSGKDYWNGVGSSSSWHGLINSSLL